MKTWQLKFGAHKMDHKHDQPSVQIRKIVRKIKNPHWNIHTLNGDQTLLELSEPVLLNSRVNMPCLPQKGVYPPLGKTCVLAGTVFSQEVFADFFVSLILALVIVFRFLPKDINFYGYNQS